MKTTGIIICLFLFMGIVSLRAQETPAMPENFIVFEEFVQPANSQAFNKVQQEAIDLWKELEFDLTFFTYSTDVSSYYWVIPIQNFAAIDQLYAKIGELSTKMKDNGFDAGKKFRDLSTTRETVIHWDKDLSYHPNGYVGQTKENRYCEWTFFYLKAGHEEEMGEAIKQYIDFFDSIDETWEWDVYTVSMGYDSPCWILMDRSENSLTLRKLESSLQEKYGETFGKLWKNMQPHLRKMDVVTGWFLPDWSMNFE